MTVVVIYHDVAKCYLGKLKHKAILANIIHHLSCIVQFWPLTGL